MLASNYEVVEVYMLTSLKLLRGKIISNIFKFRGQRTLKPKLKFILKYLIFSQFKTK